MNFRAFTLMRNQRRNLGRRLRFDEALALDLSGRAFQARLSVGSGLRFIEDATRAAVELVFDGALWKEATDTLECFAEAGSGGVHSVRGSHLLLLEKGFGLILRARRQSGLGAALEGQYSGLVRSVHGFDELMKRRRHDEHLRGVVA